MSVRDGRMGMLCEMTMPRPDFGARRDARRRTGLPLNGSRRVDRLSASRGIRAPSEVHMPVRIPDDLPAAKQLEEENIFVMTKERAFHQDIRELRIAVLNLMPTKIVTETQLLQASSATPPSRPTYALSAWQAMSPPTPPSEHLDAFYEPLDKILEENVSTVSSITGAPVENPSLRGSGLLARTRPPHGLVDDQCLVDPPHLLGCPGRASTTTTASPNVPLPRKTLRPLLTIRTLDSLGSHSLRGFDEVLPTPPTPGTPKWSRLTISPPSPTSSCSRFPTKAGVYHRRVEATTAGSSSPDIPNTIRLTLKAEYDRDIAKGLDD